MIYKDKRPTRETILYFKNNTIMGKGNFNHLVFSILEKLKLNFLKLQVPSPNLFEQKTISFVGLLFFLEHY